MTLTFCKLVLILCWQNASTVTGMLSIATMVFYRGSADFAFYLTTGKAQL
ncbi:MAG: hypothetical protein K2P84_12080 [Undibacterium sp.]|nr:hypothetical protein [Undibacterium sp.]